MKNATSYNLFLVLISYQVRAVMKNTPHFHSFLSTKNFPDTLPWFTTKMQFVSSFIKTQSASFISIITNEP